MCLAGISITFFFNSLKQMHYHLDGYDLGNKWEYIYVNVFILYFRSRNIKKPQDRSFNLYRLLGNYLSKPHFCFAFVNETNVFLF